MEGNLAFSAGESGEDRDISVCGEKGDLIESVDERRGASRAMTESTGPSTQRREGGGHGCGAEGVGANEARQCGCLRGKSPHPDADRWILGRTRGFAARVEGRQVGPVDRRRRIWRRVAVGRRAVACCTHDPGELSVSEVEVDSKEGRGRRARAWLAVRGEAVSPGGSVPVLAGRDDGAARVTGGLDGCDGRENGRRTARDGGGAD